MTDEKKKTKHMTDEELLEFAEQSLESAKRRESTVSKRATANATMSLAACALLRERRAMRKEKEAGMESEKDFQMNPPF